jgi:hypothetical protein
MSKIADIQRQLEKASGRASTVPPPAAPTPPAFATEDTTPRAKAPSREGKIHVGAYLHPDFKRSLRMVQAQTGKDIQALLAQALNELFRAHNVPVTDHD